MNKPSAARFEELQKRLFEGRLDVRGGIELWIRLMRWPRRCTAELLLHAFLTNAVLRVVEDVVTISLSPFHLSQHLLVLTGKDVGYLGAVFNIFAPWGLGPVLVEAGLRYMLTLCVVVRNLSRLVDLT
jgi:hypothetical protein